MLYVDGVWLSGFYESGEQICTGQGSTKSGQAQIGAGKEKLSQGWYRDV